MAKSSDIQAALLARANEPVTPRTILPTPTGARPYVAEAGQRLADGLREENQRLKAERASGLLVLRIDPKRVRATQFKNRDERSFLSADPKFQELKDSIRANGQEQPIKLRPLTEDPSADFEIVSGHRRHRVCLELDAEIAGGFTVAALLDAKAHETRDLVLKMYRENEERADLSPYEKGLMFRQWLREEVFTSQGEIAKAIRSSDATVTKYLQIAELPDVVLNAFKDPREIAVRWAHDLIKALKSNPSRVEDAAGRLADSSPRLNAVDVVRELIASAQVQKDKRGASREQAIKIGGRVALRIQRRDGRFALKFYKLDKNAQKAIVDELLEIAEKRVRDALKGENP